MNVLYCHWDTNLGSVLLVWYSKDEVRLIKKTVEDKDNDIKMLKEQINTNAQQCSSDRQTAMGEITRTE